MGNQTSAWRAARLSAGPLSPPVQIGGCGRCTGFGSKTMPSKAANSPAMAGFSSVQSVLNASRYSPVTRPRASKSGAPMASNSSRSQPAPMPRSMRPPESTSMVATALAVNTAGRCGTTMTAERMRAFFVTAATWVIRMSWSMQSPQSPVSLPETSYG